MHQVTKVYIRGACAEIREDGETSPGAGSFGGTNMELWVRGMTIVGAVNRVLQWAQGTECWHSGTKVRGSYRGHYLANARRSGRAVLRSGTGRKADDSSWPRAASKIINDQHAARRTVSCSPDRRPGSRRRSHRRLIGPVTR